MQILAIIIAGRYGPQPYPGPIFIGFIIIVAIVAGILAIVNRKELDQIIKDAKEKKETMLTYWVPGVNHLGTYGRWAFLELTDVFLIKDQFAQNVEEALNNLTGTSNTK